MFASYTYTAVRPVDTGQPSSHAAVRPAYEVIVTAPRAVNARCTATFRYDSYQCSRPHVSLKGIVVVGGDGGGGGCSQVTLHRLMPAVVARWTPGKGREGLTA